MQTPLRYIIDDAIVSLKQTIDDAEISRPTIAFWVINIANRLKALHIDKRDSGAMLTTFPKVPVVTASNSQFHPDGRKYFTLPASIFDFDKDNAIHYIAYESDGGPNCPPRFTQVRFQRTNPASSRRLYWNPYEKPSPSNPYFYRTLDDVVLLGVENIKIKSVEIGVYAAIQQVTNIDEDMPIELPEELIMLLQRQILDLGRFVLNVPEDKRNDGDEIASQGIASGKMVSVQSDNTQQAE
jgi:hypothetical protein